MSSKPVARAIAFIPAGHPLDGRFAQQIEEHGRRRGYDPVQMMLREWTTIEFLLNTGQANTVVMVPGNYFSTPEHAAGLTAGDTVPIARLHARMVSNSRPASLAEARRRVREVIDGDGPIPDGLDPESIAAARRIAQHLAECNQPRV